MSTSKDAVSYFFLTDDRKLTSGATHFYEICSAEFTAFLAIDGDMDVATQQFMMQQGRVFRWAPVYEACGKPGFCRIFGASQSCFVHSANKGPLSRTSTLHAATLYFTDIVYTIRTRYSGGYRPPGGNPCVFVTLQRVRQLRRTVWGRLQSVPAIATRVLWFTGRIPVPRFNRRRRAALQSKHLLNGADTTLA
ncbi:hypothetical protein MRX96_045172 [Rhipicephalus microplus]